MIGALIIVLREVVEAGLILGIVLAVTQTIPSRMPYIVGGVLAGLFGAVLVAIFAAALSNAFEGVGQELFNASILGVAVIMLTWHNVWMARHGRQLSEDLRRVGGQASSGACSLIALAVVIGVAILREGSEVVLFLYGVVLSSGDAGFGVFLGGLIGLLLGAGVCLLTYRGLVAIPTRRLFQATSILIGFMAAGMAAQSVAFLEQADLATALGRIMWNSSSILPDTGVIGRVLHALIGYTDKPTALQLVAYVGTLGGMFGLMKLLSRPAKQTRRLTTN